MAWVALVFATSAAAVTPLPTTRQDFTLPGTQPLTITTPISTPDTCSPCHSGFGEPAVEPFQNWKGSMMAQSGRDPLMLAALAVANQDAPHAGETCLRCHLPKGWLEGRSAPEDGSAMTADDRQGVQCGVCHRLVDPVADPMNPAEDAAILAALAGPVPGFGNAMFVVDPLDRLRGPFDVVADNGSDPHAPDRSTLVSRFHREAALCGTCHNLRNPAFTKNPATGAWEPNPMDAPTSDPMAGFPEQSTFDEWAASAYATAPIPTTQLGGNATAVSTCQDCHMPRVTGHDAKLAVRRTDIPRHVFAGANAFVPALLPSHPAFGPEVDPLALADGRARAVEMLRKAATVTGTFDGATLTVRVTNETGHKLPTGYPEGRRMWLHVRAFDARRRVVFESGRYVFGTATLAGADPGTAPDAQLHVWETQMGVSPDVAALAAIAPGRTFHLVLNNVRLKDNRIPPRGFTNAAFAAFDAEPVGAAYADGQHWDDVVYPVGSQATAAEVTLYYQTASRPYVEFLRDENTTTSAGGILHDLYEQVDRSTPVAMATLLVERTARNVRRCRAQVASLQRRYGATHRRAWEACFAREVGSGVCDPATRDARLAGAASALREKLGGAADTACAGASLTPASLGQRAYCPAPCGDVSLFDVDGLASCAICIAGALNDAALGAAYGAAPPALPPNVPAGAAACQKRVERAALGLADGWSDAITACARRDPSKRDACDDDPRVRRAKARAAAMVRPCAGKAGLRGCATAGDAAAVAACLEHAIGPVAHGYAEVAAP
jgi:cytochrome c554/c'-like protein